MTFAAISDQDTAVETLRRAVQREQLHHAYRFEGPDGVGKELTALALAQAFACSNSAFGCGECSACLRVLRFVEGPPAVPQHPDVILVGRGLYPSNIVAAKETTGISVEQIRRVVLPRVAHGPHESRGLFVIIRRAEELTIAAANSLLKTLEEPRPRVHFILLTSAPGQLLDTIRSRTLALRFGPLSESTVRRILEARGENPALAARANGSAANALELAASSRSEREDQFAAEFDAALGAPNIDRALELAANLPKDREIVLSLLLAYSRYTAEQARTCISTAPQRATLLARRYQLIERALGAIDRNGTAQAVVEALASEIRNGL